MDLQYLTYRELLANRALARRRRRGRDGASLVARIDAELERRRQRKAERLAADVPPIAALDG